MIPTKTSEPTPNGQKYPVTKNSENVKMGVVRFLKTHSTALPGKTQKMHSLYDVLLAQHSRQVTPVRCAYSTIVQLHRYFEDVVLENSLSALIIESLPLSAKRSAREKARVRHLARGGRRAFFS